MTVFEPGARVTYIHGPTYASPRYVGKVGTVTEVLRGSARVKFDDGNSRVCYVDNLKPSPVPNGWGYVREGLSKHKAAVDKALDVPADDVVALPSHYRNHPSGVECITITQHMNFCRGNAIKYVWRAGEKGGPEKEIEDLRKARQYLDIEIKRLENNPA